VEATAVELESGHLLALPRETADALEAAVTAAVAAALDEAIEIPRDTRSV
jgi:hypothetical protein